MLADGISRSPAWGRTPLCSTPAIAVVNGKSTIKTVECGKVIYRRASAVTGGKSTTMPLVGDGQCGQIAPCGPGPRHSTNNSATITARGGQKQRRKSFHRHPRRRHRSAEDQYPKSAMPQPKLNRAITQLVSFAQA